MNFIATQSTSTERPRKHRDAHRTPPGTVSSTGVVFEQERVRDVWRASDAPTQTTTFAPRDRSELANRVVNVAIASTALVALSPVFVLVAAAVKFTSPGPIFYRQTRVGIDRRRQRAADATLHDRRGRDLGGQAFTIYKFRSMRADAEKKTGAVWAAKADPRVTPVGRFIRKCRLDELPQLINVIRGEMNIVGPRPERPGLFQQLSISVEGYPLRQLAKPGITGLAQISQRYDTCLDDVRNKVRYDLEYLQRQGVAEDLKIMLKTIPVMLLRKGGW